MVTLRDWGGISCTEGTMSIDKGSQGQGGEYFSNGDHYMRVRSRVRREHKKGMKGSGSLKEWMVEHRSGKLILRN
jgi:hypothetical protein